MKNIFLKKQILLFWVFAYTCHMTLTNELHKKPLKTHKNRLKEKRKKIAAVKKALIGIGTLATAVGFAYWYSQHSGTPSADTPDSSHPSSIIPPIPSASSPMQVPTLAAEEKVEIYDVKQAQYHVYAFLGLSILHLDRTPPVYLVSVLKTTEEYEKARKNNDLCKWISIDKEVFQLNKPQKILTRQPDLKYDDYKLMICANTGAEYRKFIAEYASKTPLEILLQCEEKIRALEQKSQQDQAKNENSPEYKQKELIAPVRANLNPTQLLLYDSQSNRGWVGEMFALHRNGNTPEITEFKLKSLPDQKGIVDGQTRIIVPLEFLENEITVFGTISEETTTYRLIKIDQKYQFHPSFQNFVDSPIAPTFRALSASHLGQAIS